jgi:hypothetical protein
VGDSAEEDGAGGCAFEFGDSEETAVVAEHGSFIRDDFGEDARFVVIRLPDVVLGSVKEDVLLNRVTVEVEEEHQSAFEFPFQLARQLLQGFHLRDQEIVPHFERPVQVSPAQGRAVVPYYHSVRV